MASLILIHGAWHGGWCWEQVVPLLQARGHVALAPDLPGMGADRTPWAEDVLGQWTDFLAALVEAQPEPVVLVGHSRGAIITSTVAQRLPDQIALAVYLAGYSLADGEALKDVRAASDAVYSAVSLDGAGTGVTIDMLKAVDLFYGRCDPVTAARAAERLTVEPLQPGSVSLHLSPDRYGRVPRAYIETTDDHALPIGLQREAQSRWTWERIVTLLSDHSPHYSMPERLAEVLDDLARAGSQKNSGFHPRIERP